MSIYVEEAGAEPLSQFTHPPVFTKFSFSPLTQLHMTPLIYTEPIV